MTLSRFIILISVAFVTISVSASDIDNDVIVGRLSNGLTYYIRHNENPEGRADFFLAQRAGSVLEDDDQRGLAHFLEHMCFNGTEHFPGNSLISYLESIGVKFGAHLNAYTSTDETVYNICKVPVGRSSIVDSCLMIIRDWSCALLLNSAEIDAERGVIVNEWRQRRSASNRMLEKASPFLYGGTRYGYRLPIGVMSVIESFEPSTLRRFYDKWYIPVNQAVIVVGDIDVKSTERRLKKLFGKIPASRSPLSTKIAPIEVPVGDSFNAVVVSDIEQGSEMLQLYFRITGRRDSIVDDVACELATNLLVNRIDFIEDSDDCPHLSLAIGSTKYLMAGGEKAFTMRGSIKPGCSEKALKLWYGEILRAVRNGFRPVEIENARKDMKASALEKYKNASSLDNSSLARKCVRHFIDGGMQISNHKKYDNYCAVVDTITAYSAVQYLSRLVNEGGRGCVALNYRPESDISNDSVAAALSRAFNEAYSKEYTKFAFSEHEGQLLDEQPAAGEVVYADSIAQFNTKVFGLSNGIKVFARQSMAVPGQVYVRGFRPGGVSLHYDTADVATLKVLNEMMAEMPCNGMSGRRIRRLVGDKKAKVSISITNDEDIVEAATSPDDMETAFELLYLRVTGFEADSTAFKRFIDSQRNKVEHRRYNPVQAMGDTIHSAIYSHHPLATRMTAADIDRINLCKGVEIYRDRFADMSDFSFLVVGDFDKDSIAEMLCKYIASLPAGKRVEHARDIGYRFTPNDFKIDFAREMENAQGIVYAFRRGTAKYDIGNIVAATAFGQLLRAKLLNELREKQGVTYSVRTHAAINPGVNRVDGPQLLMPAYIKVTPGYEDSVAAAVNEAIEAMADSRSIDDMQLAGIKEFLIRNHADARKDGAYWLKVLKSYLTYGVDIDSDYDAAVAHLTPDKVAAFVKNTVLTANKASIIMRAKTN